MRTTVSEQADRLNALEESLAEHEDVGAVKRRVAGLKDTLEEQDRRLTDLTETIEAFQDEWDSLEADVRELSELFLRHTETDEP